MGTKIADKFIILNFEELELKSKARACSELASCSSSSSTLSNSINNLPRELHKAT